SCCRRWRRAALVLGGLAVAAGVGWGFRDNFIHSAKADPAPAAVADSPAEPSDYSQRIVAYIHGTTAISRQELGEYLIARMGYEKLPLLLNKRIVDDACKARGIEITAAEVETALAQTLKGMQIDRATFVKTVLSRYRKNLTEWKEDVLRPRLQMTRLVQD